MRPKTSRQLFRLPLLLALLSFEPFPAVSVLPGMERQWEREKVVEGSFIQAIPIPPSGIGGIQRSGATISLSGSLDILLRLNVERRVGIEFDVSGVSGTVPFTTLGLWLENSDPNPPAGTLEIRAYLGDGAITTSDFDMGLGSFFFRSLSSTEPAQILNLDVTSALQTAVDSGAHFLGFRLSTITTDRLRVGGTQAPTLTVGGFTRFVPVLDHIYPGNVAAGSQGFTLEVSGDNFAPGAVVQWNGSDRPTVSDVGWARAEIAAGDLVSPGVAQITVLNPGPGGGVSSSLPFVVRARITYYVDDDAAGDPAPNDPSASDPLEDGSQQHPFDTVQEALALSYAEDTIKVLPGTYVEDLTTTRDGGALIGSGKANTIIRSPSGAGLVGESDFINDRPLRLRLQDFTYEGGPIGLVGRLDLGVTGLSIHGGSLWLRPSIDFASTISIDGLEMDGGTIMVWAAPGSDLTPLTVTVSHLVAPTAEFDFVVASLAGYSSVALSDSLLGGLGFHGEDLEGGTSSLSVRGVHFAAGGLQVTFTSDGFFQGIVEDSIFDGGGIEVAHPRDVSGYSGGDSTTIHRCRFHGGGITYSLDSGSYTLLADSNYFQSAGIEVLWNRSDWSNLPYTSMVRAINNIFDRSSAGIDATYTNLYSQYGGLPPGQGSYRIEAFNNTFVGSETGVRISAFDLPAQIDTIRPVLDNNIIAYGAEGIRLEGVDPEMVTMYTNDLYGNAAGNYVGALKDRTGRQGNISADPRFVSLSGGDYHLRQESPCIDAAITLLGIVVTDFDGRPRPLPGRPEGNALTDIGAYEFSAAAHPRDGGGGGAAGDRRDLRHVDAGHEER